ncbi:MAG TPA: hypothetical protein PKH39_06375, partial [Woeseiaceae bacterium]|nr:hypothetical protein [Woeseiaceae bacterium]
AAAVSNIAAPGFSDIVGQFKARQDGIEWIAGEKVFKVVDAAWRATEDWPGESLDIVLDTRQFIDARSGAKIGLGSSAAVTAALCAAIAGSADIADVAYNTHRILQGDLGSGVDVACSLHGGLIHYRMQDSVTSGMPWPRGLQFRLIWTGVAASTAGKLGLLPRGASAPSRTRLAMAAESMASAWEKGDVDDVIDRYAHYIEQLQAFGVDHRLGIFDAGHDRLLVAARDAGLVYKPCGAGGGDIGIALGTDATELDGFVADLPANFSAVRCELDFGGTRIEELTAR